MLLKLVHGFDFILMTSTFTVTNRTRLHAETPPLTEIISSGFRLHHSAYPKAGTVMWGVVGCIKVTEKNELTHVYDVRSGKLMSQSEGRGRGFSLAEMKVDEEIKMRWDILTALIPNESQVKAES